jgi:Tol biopolymer transport system component
LELREQIQSALGSAYGVERELGGGGMSRVFVATETALGRRIVVKILPPDAMGALSIDRFKREIRLAASLQHPHIVPLLAAGDIDGLPYYTMPFVKGESLRDRLVKGGELSVGDTLHILRDVASALAYAHSEGVVHRDIKPDNIILSGGVAVVTDFGVAKALDVAGHEATNKSSLTSHGVALGTPAYMSPEQASADPQVDHRADIYSFGCVAYEMLAGASPFAGRPAQQTLAAQVQEQPEPIVKRRGAVSPALGALVMKCLEKRPGDRPQSAAEVLAAIDAVATPTGGSQPTGARLSSMNATQHARRRGLLIGGGATLLVVAAIAATFFVREGTTHAVRPGRVTPVATTSALEMDPAISPDGKFVAFMSGAPGSFHIFVRQIAGERSVDVSGSIGGEHARPNWSPDGSQIAFVANSSAYAVAATGGSPKILVQTPNAPITDVAWSPDGSRLAYANSEGIFVKPISGGDARRLVAGETLHSLSWSPNGTRLAFVDGVQPTLDNLSSAPLKVVEVSTGKVTVIEPGQAVNLSPAWTPDGKSILFISSRDGPLDVYQQPVTSDGQPRGLPLRVTTGLSARRVTLSADGANATYDVVRNRSNIWSVTMPPGNGVASTATARQITNDNQRIESLSLSHDGRWLAYDSDRSGNADIYRVAVDGGEPVQVTTSPANDFAPSWSADDRRLLFHSNRDGHRELYSIGADGSDEQQLTHARMELFQPILSKDGQHLFASAGPLRGPSHAYDIVFDKDAAGHWTNMHRITPPGVTGAWLRLSADGKWLGYSTSDANSPSFVGGAARVMSVEGRNDHVVLDLQPREMASYVAFGTDPNTVYVMATNPESRQYTVYQVPIAGGTPRPVLRDDPTHRISRWDFATDGRHLYVTLAADESDVYVMSLNR